ncbi:MFS transporter [Luteipulveratus halotolerans]|uniref:MFS transporter n=1 Tax=Luteipulveratus halotolerans TaxID=1631356 RepID=A0A0L6CK96_9MICO|nr:MFS transporter [Luteipulveratus halotolerans]KNX38159.1 MFS transporter [Luteipulveratus halotolerans]
MTTTDAPAATRREWIGLAVLAFPTLLLSIDMSVLYLALPSLTEQLHPTSTQQLWIMDSYGFMVAGFLVTMGTLGDRIGRRRLLLIGSAGFAAASVLAAYSTSAEMLIVARALMGITGATLMPSTLALISNMFRQPAQRGTAIAIWMSCFMGGMVVGPLTAGVMLQHFWWGSVFLLSIPMMVLLYAAAPALLPEYRDPDPGRLDLPSVLLSLAAILPVVYGLKEMARHGVTAGTVVPALAGVAVGVVFIRRQTRLTHPLIDVRLFAIRRFSVSLGINVVAGLLMAGMFFLTTLYLQLVLGLSPLGSGAWMVPVQLCMVAASLAAPRIARRVRPAYVMTAGLALTAVGYAVVGLTAITGSYDAGPLRVVIGFAIASVGIALPTALIIDLVVGSAPPEKAGSASSVSETSAELGIAFGVALLGSLSSAVYRSGLVLPDGLTSAQQAAARDSIGGAVETAQGLPAQVAADLMGSARDAFSTGLAIGAAIAVVAFAAAAVVTHRMLRDVEAYDEEVGAGVPAGPAEAPTPALAAAVSSPGE